MGPHVSLTWPKSRYDARGFFDAICFEFAKDDTSVASRSVQLFRISICRRVGAPSKELQGFGRQLVEAESKSGFSCTTLRARLVIGFIE